MKQYKHNIPMIAITSLPLTVVEGTEKVPFGVMVV